MDSDHLIEIDLSDDERDVLRCGLSEWGGPARCSDALAVAMGVQSQKQGRSRAAAMRGIGVTLPIDLPHRRESAVLWSPDRYLLDAAVDRLDR
ncbi:hypothetical protein [Nocardia sp.]|uniref:hypothetical protein n=1 Tax=Nocardia sp. TaxID=1821 RepID=UPI00262597A9|nr:hypothetical protein [Nocardia sp.]